MTSRAAARARVREMLTDSDGVTRVKLCGMFREQDVAAANAARPDLVGFVINFPRSHRSVTREKLAALVSQLDPCLPSVGVFVDEPLGSVAEVAEESLDMIQLHGHEDEAYLRVLRSLTDVPVMQAFRVRTADDIARARASTADMVLLDNGQGTGERFDWQLVERVERPFVLAGGLGPGNVAEAVRVLGPWGVDMSSGIETARIKDPAKMVAAVRGVRSATIRQAIT